MALGIDDLLHYDPTDCPSCPIGKLKREWAAEEEGLLDVLLLNMDQINPSAEDIAQLRQLSAHEYFVCDHCGWRSDLDC